MTQISTPQTRANPAGESDPQRQVLLADDLHMAYGQRQALIGLSFSLAAGHVLGFLGPNGAGKTTAIRILTTIIEPSSGRFSVAGISSQRPEQIRRTIGVLPESLGFPKQITGIEYLTYFGQLYGQAAAEASARSQTLLAEMGLQQRARSLIGTYSRGMRQRLGIARALINEPAVVFLDEPTLGLDPLGQQELLELIRRIARERGTGVILCSHLLSEIEGVCDDVVILSAGRVVAAGAVAEVIGRTQASRAAIQVRVPPPLADRARQALEALPEIAHVAPASQGAGGLRIALVRALDEAADEQGQIGNRILETLIRAGIPILGFEAAGVRLQDVFLELTAEAGR